MMRRRTFLAGSVGAAAAFAGCLSSPSEVSIEELDVEQTTQNTIEVHGTGVVEVDPDKVVLTVSVEATDRDNADVVVDKLAEQADDVRKALLDFGISEENITTTRYRLRESSRRNQYEGTHQYRVELNNPDDAGEVIDLVADTGADSIGSVDFTVSEATRDDVYDDAVSQAVEDARNEAELFMDATGQELGDPVSIETAQTGHSPFSQRVSLAYAEATDDGASTQLDSGMASVMAEATIEYAFEPAD